MKMVWSIGTSSALRRTWVASSGGWLLGRELGSERNEEGRNMRWSEMAWDGADRQGKHGTTEGGEQGRKLEEDVPKG